VCPVGGFGMALVLRSAGGDWARIQAT